MNIAELFHIKHPIIQAPMAGSQGIALAAAVSNAGGLGSLPAALLAPDALRAELTRLRELTSEPYNVNCFCHHQPEPDADREQTWRMSLWGYYNEYRVLPDAKIKTNTRTPFNAATAEVLEEFSPPVVSFHFGLPSPELLARVERTGAKVLSSATTVEEAIWLEEQGVDAIIAQGLEAGGHRGMFLTEDLTTQIGLSALLPQIVRAVKVPVIAAGGIANAQGVAAVKQLGAAGVQVGTAYLFCPEATTAKLHRAALQSAAAGHTAITNLFTGRPARGIVNRLMREMRFIRDGVSPFPFAGEALAPIRAAAEEAGKDDFSPLWAGQNARSCREMSAADLTQALAAGW